MALNKTLSELGFHKQAAFFPFPEYWAGKLDRDKLNKAWLGLNKLTHKHQNLALDVLDEAQKGTSYENVGDINNRIKQHLGKAEKYNQMGGIMIKADKLRAGIK